MLLNLLQSFWIRLFIQKLLLGKLISIMIGPLQCCHNNSKTHLYLYWNRAKKLLNICIIQKLCELFALVCYVKKQEM